MVREDGSAVRLLRRAVRVFVGAGPLDKEALGGAVRAVGCAERVNAPELGELAIPPLAGFEGAGLRFGRELPDCEALDGRAAVRDPEILLDDGIGHSATAAESERRQDKR